MGPTNFKPSTTVRFAPRDFFSRNFPSSARRTARWFKHWALMRRRKSVREKVSFVDTVPPPLTLGGRAWAWARHDGRGCGPRGLAPPDRRLGRARPPARARFSRDAHPLLVGCRSSRASRATSDDFPRVPPPRQVHPPRLLSPRRRDGRPHRSRTPSDRRVRLLSSRLSPRRTWRPRESSRGRSS